MNGELAHKLNHKGGVIDMQFNRIVMMFAFVHCAALAAVSEPSKAPVAASPAPAEPVRQRLLMDNNWKFALTDATGAFGLGFNDAAWRAVDLPHDWSIEGKIDPKNPTGGAGGFFPAGIGWYRRAFDAPAAWRGKRLMVEFEGVYMNADVWINGHHLGFHPYGYTSFFYDLTPHLKFDAKNVLAVRVNNSKQPNSRWYSGSGIYRHVWLNVTEQVHVAPWGVCVTTAQADADKANVVIKTTLLNEGKTTASVKMRTELLGPGYTPVGQAQLTFKLAATAKQELTQEITIDKPVLWSPKVPFMYYVLTRVHDGDTTVDEIAQPFGIRTLAWSADKGLQLNGETIKLCGGNMHHDNGCLGAAAFDRAEERRIMALKAAGFNAIRTAHNPPSPAFLDICDRVGMLVLEEAFDCWEKGKNKHDYGTVFKEWWRRDLESMVLRDRNHPSVVMWSIGNEVEERAEPAGARLGRMLADAVRALDRTRPVTAAINPVGGSRKWSDTDGLFAALDIGGYNYTLDQADEDHQRVPGRVMALTESLPREAFASWAYAADHPWMIGDFVWTAMDYLGEAGIGRPVYTGDNQAGHGNNSLFPWHGAYCGDLDLLGFRKAQSYYREILWNRTSRVYLVVREPAPQGKPLKASPGLDWSIPPALPSWTWPGQEGKPMQVEAYTDCEKVQLTLNDKVIGEAPTTRAQQFKATFTVPYAPGKLRVLGFKDGRSVTDTYLTTVGEPAQIQLRPDRDNLVANGQDLCFVTVLVTDKTGEIQPSADHQIKFSIEGPGVIVGLANGDMNSVEPYQGNTRRVFHGRALVVIRTGRKADAITLTATAPGLEPATMKVRARETSARLFLP